MEMKTAGPGVGWTWLWRGLKSVFARPKTLFGALALLMAFVLALTAITLVVQLVWGQSVTAMLASNVVMMAVSVVVYPVMCGGYLRILHAVEHQQAAAATDLFGPFQPGGGAGRMILVGLGMFVIYAAFLGLLFTTIGHDVGAWYLHLMETGMHTTGKAPDLPPMPGGLAATVAVLMLFGMFYSAAFAIAMGQAALRRQPVMAAIRDGLVGAIRNLLPLLVLALCGLVAFFVFAIVLGMMVMIITLLASFVSAVLAVVLMVPLYAALMLYMYAVMLGVMYAIWQDVTGAPPPVAAPFAADRVEA